MFITSDEVLLLLASVYMFSECPLFLILIFCTTVVEPDVYTFWFVRVFGVVYPFDYLLVDFTLFDC